MDWEALRERTLGEVTTSLVSEGAGVTGGFLAAGFVGRQIQDRIKSDDAIVTSTDKVMAWTANNVPKIAMWYLLRRYTSVEPGEELTPLKEATVDAKKAVAGSIIFDTLVRLSKGGKNPAEISLFGYRLLSGGSGSSPEIQKTQADIQRLIQENSALRAELNKALQRLAAPVQQPVAVAPVQVVSQPVMRAAPAPAPVVNVTPTPQIVQQAPPVVRYQPATPPVVSYSAPPMAVQPIPPAVSERERKYGFMQSDQTPPGVQERERKFGFMRAGEEGNVASMFGML